MAIKWNSFIVVAAVAIDDVIVVFPGWLWWCLDMFCSMMTMMMKSLSINQVVNDIMERICVRRPRWRQALRIRIILAYSSPGNH